jgi:2-iminoacetate synthase
VADAEFLRLVAILRLAVPYTGLILSTREPAALRDRLFDLGVSQVSADSRTSPGGYTDDAAERDDCQFFLNDHRTLDEVAGALLERGYLPSFCTACYRRERTGERFMKLARPGLIKGNCTVNALVTLKEYLDDFASPAVWEAGAKALEEWGGRLDWARRMETKVLLHHVQQGYRDAHV